MNLRLPFGMFITVFTGYSLIAFNRMFFDAFFAGMQRASIADWLFQITIVGILAGFQMVLCLVCMWPYTTKLLSVILLLCNAGALYFMQQFQVIIDYSMIANIFATDWRETSDLSNPKLFSYVIVLGAFPALLLVRCQIVYPSIVRQILLRIAGLAVIVGLVSGAVFLQFKEFSTHFRLHRQDQNLWIPRNYLWGLYRLSVQSHLLGDQTVIPLGSDAHYRAQEPSKLVVLVIGETARAASFQLLGYDRATNPELAQIQDLTIFPNTQACGTSTQASLPCMFSALDRKAYAARQGVPEKFPALFARLGVKTAYIGNNFGNCKGACDGIPTEYTHEIFRQETSRFCNGFECHDEILVDRLQHYLENTPLGDQLIILHQNGSHGPRYDKRVPPEFVKFTPVCESSDIRQCTQNELINAYDNTIVYTDYVLARIIATLRDTKRPALMMYLSDHGESLGENGVYLHGMPYMIAPKEQTEVPFLLWTSEHYRAHYPYDLACVTRQSAYSHANLFHTVAGIFQISMREYDRDLDIFADCSIQ